VSKFSHTTGGMFAAVICAALTATGAPVQAQGSAEALAQCAPERAAATRLACFERAAFIEAAARFGSIHNVFGGCMARLRETDRLACFETQTPRIVQPAAAPPLPAVTLRPAQEPQAARPLGAAPAAPPSAAPSGMARTAPPPPRTGQPSPRTAQALPAPADGAARAGDSGWLATLGRDAAASGLYLRGQLGYAAGLDADIKDTPPSGTVIACLARGTRCGGELDDVGSSVTFGAGLGYRWNRQVRFDVTLDYRPGFAVDDSDQATPFAANYKGDITSLVTLVNAYWDLPVDLGQYAGWLGRVRPWVGLGLGVARNELDDLSYSQRLASGATARGRLPGSTATSFAWQAGLGLGIELLPQLTLDFGYRYLDAGDIKTKAGRLTDSVAGVLPVGEAKGELKSHEFQVGLRYQL